MHPFLFIFGLGYVGQHIAQHMIAQKWRVRGTTRTRWQQILLQARGIDALLWNGEVSLPALALEGITHVLVTIAPFGGEDVVLKHHSSLTDSLQWAGYLSSTAVYGNHEGQWVTEESTPDPSSDRGMERLKIEKQWLDNNRLPSRVQANIFRLSGIYGPKRNILESILAGTAKRIRKPGHVFSRIHQEDITGVIAASMTAGCSGEIYNLADDKPASTASLVEYGCSLLNLPLPPLIPFDSTQMSPELQKFYADSKQVSNRKIKKNLGITLKFPTYCDGLKDCLQDSGLQKTH
jgi:nucleoside-diphosphate-sugar epimerase